MTCAEYNEYILLLPTFWIKMFDVKHFSYPLKCIPGPRDVKMDRKKPLEKNTSALLCDSVLQTQ